jgi:hypothetical protein
MATRKHKSKAIGKVTWSYVFDAPGSSRTDRRQVALYGFATRKEAQEAEMLRKIEVQKAHEASLRGTPPPPNTLAALIQEFCKEHADRNLAAKTVERYRELAGYLSSALLAMPITEITPLHLTRRMEPPSRIRRAPPPNKGGARTLQQDGAQYRGRRVERLHAVHQVGTERNESRP